MKVLFIIHDASLKSIKAILNAIAEQPDIHLRVLSGSGGYNPFRGEHRPKPRLEPGDKFELALGHIRNAKESIFNPFRFGIEWQLLTYRPDVVHVHCEFGDLKHWQTIRYRKLLRPSCLLTCSGLENLVPPPRNEAAQAYFDYVASQTDSVFYWNSEGLNKLISYGLPPEKGCLSFWGVQLPPLAQDESKRQTARRLIRDEMSLQDSFVLGYVGRMVRIKGVDLVLQALSRLPGNTKGLFVGDGAELDDFKTLARELGIADRARFVGWVEEGKVYEMMSALDVLIVPSRTTELWKEQFGRVIVEAMALRVPIIGSDSGAIPEVIADAGLVFHEDDLDGCVDHVLRLMSDTTLRQDLANKGYQRFERLFSTQAHAKRLVTRWQALVSK